MLRLVQSITLASKPSEDAAGGSWSGGGSQLPEMHTLLPQQSPPSGHDCPKGTQAGPAGVSWRSNFLLCATWSAHDSSPSGSSARRSDGKTKMEAMHHTFISARRITRKVASSRKTNLKQHGLSQ